MIEGFLILAFGLQLWKVPATPSTENRWEPLPSNRPLLLVLGLGPALRSGCPAKPGPVSSRRAAESLDLGVHESSPTVVACRCFWFPYIERLEDDQVSNPKFLEPGSRVRIFS